ncbi:hypothetical protein L873DRAFT_1848834 [Choiromyces venosus 120613-1]|uniref:Uncharacterized protein n=1 Tax=Choiromyces venosus 120613-1 TaxID=1336337 RepID=A0A3N4IVY1_9PEZI|nr:hypothetical protein L873DRAFT_1848834 [Choiromyces venosus 120613-1]
MSFTRNKSPTLPPLNRSSPSRSPSHASHQSSAQARRTPQSLPRRNHGSSDLPTDTGKILTELIHEAAIGSYTATLPLEYLRSPPPPSNLFSIACEHTAQINDRLDAGTVDLEVGMLHWVRNHFSFYKGKVGKQREDSSAVSNGGSWDGEIGLDRVVFSQSAGVTSVVDTRELRRGLEGVRRGVEGAR